MSTRKFNILTLYDGISSIQVAMYRAGFIDYECYASEIDRAAVMITQHWFPNTHQIGDVTKVKVIPNPVHPLITINPLGFIDFVYVDMIVGGSPCQDMSRMGKGKGITTVDGDIIPSLGKYEYLKARGVKMNSSALFWEFVRILKEIQKYNPDVLFLLENVASKKWEPIITEALGVKPWPINSNLVSAQNRDRRIWTSIPYSPIEDKKIMIWDVIPDAVKACGTRGKKYKGDDFYTPHTTYRTDGKANCVVRSPYSTNRYINTNGEDIMITPEQAEVLQTLPVGYTDVKGVTKTQRYSAIGNAWTIDVIVEGFLKNLRMTYDSKLKHKMIYF
jgi:site-specific DNA-cytosine methylase